MRISKSTLKSLIALTEGYKVPSSSLTGEIAQTLIKEEILMVEVHGRKKCYYAKSGEELRTYLSCNYRELQNIDEYLELLENPGNITRAQLTQITGDSKARKHRTCEGFLINTYSPVSAVLCGKQIVIEPDEGSYVFIANPESFYIPDNVIVVGIENMENFYEIRSQKYLFDKYVASEGQNILFVSRYPQKDSKDLQKWLQNVPNRYVHFGDFDPAGIRIYQSEFLQYMSLDRCLFLVPDDIENKIVKGSTVRYDAQLNILNTLDVIDKRLIPLVEIIRKYHKCCDQEVYIIEQP